MQKKTAPPVALITGAARRIGAAIARQLHDAGFNIVVHYKLSAAAAAALCAALNQLRPASAVMMPVDLCVPEHVADLVPAAAAVWGRLDVLVNNAASFYRTPLGATALPAWTAMLQCNLTAPFFLTQAAAPYLQATRGCVVNIADVHGQRPMRDYAAYCVAKAGLIMLTQACAKELAPAVRVNALALGPAEPAEGANALLPAVREKILARTPLARVGSAVDVANAVKFLVCDAPYVTGAVLAVDGGRSLMI